MTHLQSDIVAGMLAAERTARYCVLLMKPPALQCSVQRSTVGLLCVKCVLAAVVTFCWHTDFLITESEPVGNWHTDNIRTDNSRIYDRIRTYDLTRWLLIRESKMIAWLTVSGFSTSNITAPMIVSHLHPSTTIIRTCQVFMLSPHLLDLPLSVFRRSFLNKTSLASLSELMFGSSSVILLPR